MFEIIEQLQDYCDCLPETEDGVFEKNVKELINLISILTCWTQKPCENFLNAERVETLDIEHFDPCSCENGIMEFSPFYTPFDPLSFEVFLVKQEGVNETVEPLDIADYMYSDTFGVLRINISKYIKNIKCGCPENYKLVIKYIAGYELLPDCLLQLFCDLLHIIADKNNCDCSACQACGKGDEAVIEFDSEVAKDLDFYLRKLVENGYRNQLGLISLCGRNFKSWGSVL
jgi:hypothetical protein